MASRVSMLVANYTAATGDGIYSRVNSSDYEYRGFTTIHGLYYYTRALLLYEGCTTIQGLYYWMGSHEEKSTKGGWGHMVL